MYLINSQIASLPMVHVLASIDHIRGNLLLSSGSFASFNFVFIDATTFEPYFYEKMFMSQVSQAYRYPTFIWYILVANQLRESHMFSVHSLKELEDHDLVKRIGSGNSPQENYVSNVSLKELKPFCDDS